jgi:hypothetical protein
MRLEDQFMYAMRGIPAHQVAMACTRLTPGHNYSKCSKKLLARCWTEGEPGHKHYREGLKAELSTIKAKVEELYGNPK